MRRSPLGSHEAFVPPRPLAGLPPLASRPSARTRASRRLTIPLAWLTLWLLGIVLLAVAFGALFGVAMVAREIVG